MKAPSPSPSHADARLAPLLPSRSLVLERRERAWRDSLRRRMLALADATAALLASLSFGVVFGADVQRIAWAALFVPFWVLLAKLYGLYDRDHTALRHLTVDELPTIFLWTLSGTGALALFMVATPAGSPAIGEALRCWIVAAVAAFTLRMLARFSWRRITPRERTVIVGDGAVAAATRRKVELFPDIHVQLVEVPDSVAATLSGAPEILVDVGVDRVVVASQSIDETLISRLIVVCRRHGIKLSVIPPAHGMFGTAVRLSRVADLPVVEYGTWDVSRSTLMLKRLLDVSVASTALLVLSPLFVLIALAIFLSSPGPVLFAQTRVGLGGRRFRMYKFRTMVRDAEERLEQLVRFDTLPEPMFKLTDDPRVTRVGRLLRRSSLDELPQLANVVLGHMSLVGPRPEQVELVDRYAPEQRFRLAVKPGLTGPMQVYGRGQLTFEERLAVERDYIENLSFTRDLRILAMTVAPVITGRGAY